MTEEMTPLAMLKEALGDEDLDFKVLKMAPRQTPGVGRTVEEMEQLPFVERAHLSIDQMADVGRVQTVRDFAQHVRNLRPALAQSLPPDFIRTEKRRGKALIAQSVTTVNGINKPGQSAPKQNRDLFVPVGGSHQLCIEDFFTTLDFIALPAKINLEEIEGTLFEENHLIGLTIERVAVATTRRGWEFACYNLDLEDAARKAAVAAATDQAKKAFERRKQVVAGQMPEPTEPIISYGQPADDTEDQADQQEHDALENWFDNCNSVVDFRYIVEILAACFSAEGNAWLEVVRGKENDPTASPAGLEPAIPSTMRVLKGHRGFIQWLAGRFTWFNVYMPDEKDRVAGAKLWRDYWTERGVDVDAEEFATSPWSRTMNSEMPEGVWNPYLTEMIHIKDLSLTSKYYGFPKDYRIGKLHILLEFALDYNISLLRNNRIPPFMVLYHGRLTEETEQDIQEYLGTLKGPDNWGEIPVISSPGGGGGPTPGGSSGQRGGIEIIPVGKEDKDGIFLELIALIRKEIAAHRGIPLDLLTTENSNRSTIEIAEMLFDDYTINRLHTIFEAIFKRLTKVDLGLSRRYLRFTRLDTDDTMEKAQEAKIWVDTGVLNTNEARARYLQLPGRPGGDIYSKVGVAAQMDEDEAAEEIAAAKGRAEMTKPDEAKTADAQAAAVAPAAGQTGSQNAAS